MFTIAAAVNSTAGRRLRHAFFATTRKVSLVLNIHAESCAVVMTELKM